MTSSAAVETARRLDAFALRDEAVAEYSSYVQGFINIADERVRAEVDDTFTSGRLWPDPWIQLNPKFHVEKSVADLFDDGLLHEQCPQVFATRRDDGSSSPFLLYQHQVEAIKAARHGANYVMTTGTGSGKSLTYMIPIVDQVLRDGSGKGIRAIVVYPMNALANSQIGELEKFLPNGNLAKRLDDNGVLDPDKPAGPVTFARYTGQEDRNTRNAIIENPPDILLTNYVMLEMILTRVYDRRLVHHASNLAYLVLDELHTYRGRQGADVALLLRRLAEATGAGEVRYVGTSATMASGGTPAAQRQAVADVATTVFGAPVRPDDVIGETLEPVTRDDVADPSAADVTAFAPPSDFAELATHPLAAWIEEQIGVTREADGTLRRSHPQQLPTLADQLAEVTGAPAAMCADVIRELILAGDRIVDPETDRAAFPFRLHQFVSRGSSVLATLQTEAVRSITLEPQQYEPNSDRTLRYFTLAFCRECGQDYYPVERVEVEGRVRYHPRDVGDRVGEHGGDLGFLHLSAKHPWPSHSDAEVCDRVPPDWVEEAPDGSLRVESARKKYLPQAVRVNGLGFESAVEGEAVHFVPRPFRFCLNCGVTYGPYVKSDLAKLGSLGIEGRSTATTMLTLAALRYLRSLGDAEVPAKLLNFTDNRQDASLQAGHFNDFVQVGLLRSAIFKAVTDAGPAGVRAIDIEQRVQEALGLAPEDYSQTPDAKYGRRKSIEEAFRAVLRYRIFHDLRGGWRITAPNLENVGLLQVDYTDLPDIAADDGLWLDPPEAAHRSALVAATAEQREQVCRTFLNWMRRDLAVQAEVLDPQRQEALKNQSFDTLLDPWAIDPQEQLAGWSAVLARPRIKRGKGVRHPDPEGWKYATPPSAFGRWVARSAFDDRANLKTDDVQPVITHLLAVLEQVGLVVEAGEAEGDGVPLYRVAASEMRWVAADGSPQRDLLRVPRAPEGAGTTNEFFRDFYTHMADALAGVQAREHTAQVSAKEREMREELFRADPPQIDALFCSPTMELGIDIANLNVVGLRNVPPTPANYAQRSGRAGRSGQAAFVFTYCSTGSAHDQFYFRRPQQMVAGQVAPPRIDLANEDLVRAHVQAIWLAATDQQLDPSMGEVLDISGPPGSPTIVVAPDLAARLAVPAARHTAKQVSHNVLRRVAGITAATWWTPGWVEAVVDSAPAGFVEATERWCGLYKAAVAQVEQQHRIANDHARPQYERKQAARSRATAERQRDLLLARDDAATFNSDFYSYRYFAAEGFLPGYSFPRLPLTAYLPGERRGRGSSELLNRPRFIAVSEFGPQTSIYHDGNIYKVVKAMLPIDADTIRDGGEARLLATAALCDHCGHVHRPVDDDARLPDLCVNCGTSLEHALRWPNLFRMTSVVTRRMQRINSNEEERNRLGFELRTGFTFATRDGQLDRTAARVEVNGQTMLDLAYGHTTTLTRINLGWRRRANADDHGFWLNIEDGRWMGRPDPDGGDSDDSKADDDPDKSPVTKVVPFVEDRRNTLVVRPTEALLPPDAIGDTHDAHQAKASFLATLEAAFRTAIQELYQLEDAELATVPLPADIPGKRDAFLLYEAAEGGAGVLRMLADTARPDAIAEVARAALTRMHYTPDPAAPDGWRDQRRWPSRQTDCDAACYDCLMSYGNQRDHELLDRTDAGGVKPALITLTAGTVVIDHTPSPAAHPAAAAGGNGPDPWQPLLNGVSSDLERKWLTLAGDRGHRPPTVGQRRIDDADCLTDFLYLPKHAKPTAVFIDGPHHDAPEQQSRDQADTERLADLGYRVVRFPCHDGEAWETVKVRWEEIFDRHDTPFGRARP